MLRRRSEHSDDDKTVEEEYKVVKVKEVIVQEISEEKHADIIAEIINYTHWNVDGPQVYCFWRLKYPAKNYISRSKRFDSMHEGAETIFDKFGLNWKPHIVSREQSQLVNARRNLEH
jgi:hypothetical protein